MDVTSFYQEYCKALSEKRSLYYAKWLAETAQKNPRQQVMDKYISSIESMDVAQRLFFDAVEKHLIKNN